MFLYLFNAYMEAEHGPFDFYLEAQLYRWRVAGPMHWVLYKLLVVGALMYCCYGQRYMLRVSASVGPSSPLGQFGGGVLVLLLAVFATNAVSCLDHPPLVGSWVGPTVQAFSAATVGDVWQLPILFL